MTTKPILDATGVAKNYGAVAALRNASLSLLPGEVHALMGANGAGKSTLVKILTGAIRHDAGRILIRGETREVHSPADARRAGLVSVYQEPSLIPDLDVASNLRLTGTPVAPFLDWVRELGVADLDIGETARDLPLAVLRVLDLARALAIEPDVLLLDEITAALPADLAERVLDVVRRQSKAGRSIIFISHRFVEISALCDRATVLRDGETVGVVDMTPGAEDRIVELMLGARPDHSRAAIRRSSDAGPAAQGPARLGVRNLRVGNKLNDVSFDLRDGEVAGVVALEGQGQDELFGALSGSLRPAGGDILVDGAEGEVRASGRRDPRRHRLCAGRPHRRIADATLGAREHRPAVQRLLSQLGADRHAPGGRQGRWPRSSGCRSTRAPSARCSACPAATSRR